jgi:nuclear pore complex protein Nup205
VYETKMSLLIQISQTRQGAERLLESRVLTILSQCDYLDARPEVDQMFVGKRCSFFTLHHLTECFT